MLSQKLRHRVDIQELVTTQDEDTGAVSETWATIRGSADPLFPAEIVPASGREYVNSAALQAPVDTRITIRRLDAIRPTMRVVFGSTIYNIRAILPDPTFRKHVSLMCQTGVNDG